MRLEYPNPEFGRQGTVCVMKAWKVMVAVVSILALGCKHGDNTQSLPPVSGKTYTVADVSKALDDAERFTREGKYEQALERHIWYHENALKYDPAQFGVRLSFALSYWAELGRVFPKALDALRSTRDNALASYRKAPTDMLAFGEVMSIDLALNDLTSTKDLFYEGRKNGISYPVLMLKLDQILATGDSKWAADVIGDPNARFEEMKRDREMALSALKSAEGSGPDRKVFDDMFARQIVTLVKAVAKVRGMPAARQLQKAALLYLDSPLIRDALAN